MKQTSLLVPSRQPQPWWQLPRWRFAIGAFLLGVVYSLTGLLLGLEIWLGDRDVTLAVGALIEVSFAVFGFLLGLTREARHNERLAAHELRARHDELAAVRDRLAQTEKLASLGQMASAIAHEVRNPLAILRSLAQNLSEAPDDSEDVRRTCDQWIDEIDRLAHVTSSLVGFARPLHLQRRPVRVADVAERTRLLADQLLQDRDLTLRLQSGETAENEATRATLLADGDLLCQVLLGLLENAAEAAPDGSEITLRWRASGEHVWIDIVDRGAGIPDELREQVFEPFFTTRADGNGLGLAVARQIVEAHDGTIRVVDAADPATGDAAGESNTCFRIELPSRAADLDTAA